MSDLRKYASCWSRAEPSLDEMLADPICHLIMRSDGVTLQTVLALRDRLRSGHRGSEGRTGS